MSGFGVTPYGQNYGDSTSGISGSGLGEQVAQSGRGTALWYIPAIHRVTSTLFSPRTIHASGEAIQFAQDGKGRALLGFRAYGLGIQAKQDGQGKGTHLLAIEGTGGGAQRGVTGTGQAEMIDTELELIAAFIAA